VKEAYGLTEFYFCSENNKKPIIYFILSNSPISDKRKKNMLFLEF